MTFLYPWVLLLLAVPVLLVWAVIGRGSGMVLPFDHRQHGGGWGGGWLRWTLGAFEMAPILLLAAAIVCLAGPQMLKQPRAERSLTNIEIVMDVSGSMMGSRYQLASQAVQEFTKYREGDAFGLTLFGSHQIRWIPLTKDLKAVRNAMPFADPARQPMHMGGTSIGAALKFCRRNMEAEATQGDRMIILVSDGMSSDLGGDQAPAVAAELKEAGITLYHIHVAEDSVPSEVVDLARETGGEAMQANDPETIKQVFRHIDRMRPATFKPVGTVPMDHFGPFALAALILSAGHAVGLLGMRYTPW